MPNRTSEGQALITSLTRTKMNSLRLRWFTAFWVAVLIAFGAFQYQSNRSLDQSVATLTQTVQAQRGANAATLRRLGQFERLVTYLDVAIAENNKPTEYKILGEMLAFKF